MITENWTCKENLIRSIFSHFDRAHASQTKTDSIYTALTLYHTTKYIHNVPANIIHG